jgi:hypothetical protein
MERAGAEPVSGTAGMDAPRSSPGLLVGSAPTESGAGGSDALETGLSGRTIAMGHYTGDIARYREAGQGRMGNPGEFIV